MAAEKRIIDKHSPIPAYHQITSHLVERISLGEWRLGDKLPTEEALAQEYNVSRITLRQAMTELEHQELISRQRGRGAFLVGTPSPFVESLNLPGMDHKVSHLHYDREILGWEKTDHVEPALRKAFSLTENRPLVHLSRLFLLDGKTLALNRVWLPEELVPGIMEEGLLNGSISDTMAQRYGEPFARIENYIAAGRLNAADAALMHSVYDTPVLEILSTHFLADGRPAQFSRTMWVGSLVRFHFSTGD